MMAKERHFKILTILLQVHAVTYQDIPDNLYRRPMGMQDPTTQPIACTMLYIAVTLPQNLCEYVNESIKPCALF